MLSTEQWIKGGFVVKIVIVLWNFQCYYKKQQKSFLLYNTNLSSKSKFTSESHSKTPLMTFDSIPRFNFRFRRPGGSIGVRNRHVDQ